VTIDRGDGVAGDATTAANIAAAIASAAAAAASEAAAGVSETNAAASESAAAASASAASTSETNAAASASAASTSETNAAASASAASTSETNAAASESAAAASYDAFDDRYLGAKSSDPSLDNDGDALITGALYFNTTSDEMMVYTGSAWIVASISATYVDERVRRKNRIVNGNFDIWQRGTSQTSSGYGSDDRWLNQNGGSTKTHSRQTFAPGQTDVPGEPRYFARTVVSSVAGAGNYVLKAQRIESVRTLAGQNAVLSFWAKADISRDIAVEFVQSFGTGGAPSANVTGIGVTTITLTASWQKFTVAVSIPSISGKTLGTTNDGFLQVYTWLDAGSDYNARTNSLGQQSGTFDIAQVQLEPGSVATEFEYRSEAEELALCQRYFEKSYDVKVVPGTASNSNGAVIARAPATAADHHIRFSVSKRSAPTMAGYSTVTGAAGYWRDASTAADIAVSFFLLGENGADGYVTLGDGSQYQGHWTADAEL